MDLVHPQAARIRNLTTIGHVDHGKTTYVDSLLAANNIISPRMAGKIRYMDSREDEQQRGITMESSAVSLRFQMIKEGPGGDRSTESYVVNLIDTPGHVDFSTEVSTASRLCDGALVLVDVVEGVCTQTIAVLRQAWQDRLRPILVINKMDRLITELKLAPVEAHHHLTRLIEQVNAVMGGFFAGERMEDDLRWREERDRRLQDRKDRESTTDVLENEGTDSEFQEKDDEDIYFAPDRGNVIFASAVDGWAFRVGKFAQLYAAKMGIKEANLRRALWGEWYLDPKNKRVIGRKHLFGRNLKPLFVQFVLENIWAVYQNVVISPNTDKVNKIVTTLNLKIPSRDLNSKDSRHLLSTIFSKWLSLSTCTFQAVVEVVPPPPIAQRTRIPKMLYPDLRDFTVEPHTKLERDLYSCNPSSLACITAYVSKMFAVPRRELPEHKKRALTADEMRQRAREAREKRKANGDDTASEGRAISGGQVNPDDSSTIADTVQHDDESSEALLGFARLYSGTLMRGATLYCVLPKYQTSLSPDQGGNARHLAAANITALYVMMGRDLVPVESVQAGNVFAVEGLEGIVLRNGTLCSPNGNGLQESSGLQNADHDRDCLVNLAGISMQAASIVRVALEPAEPGNMSKLIKGLRLLSQADPCVETFQQQTGEYVILTAGELHLERCLKDLRERFAGVEIQASKPIVPFRETAVRATEMAPSKHSDMPRGTVKGSSAHSLVTFTLRAVPLPPAITSFLQTNAPVLQYWQRERHVGHASTGADTENEAVLSREEEIVGTEAEIEGGVTVRPEDFWSKLEEVCKVAGTEWEGVPDRIWAFGPKRVGSCILVDSSGNDSRSLRTKLRTALYSGQANPSHTDARVSDTAEEGKHFPDRAFRLLRDFDASVENGFQIATFQGPLCAEPVVGIAYFVDSLEFDHEAMETDEHRTKLAQVTGSLISAVREACRNGMLDWSPRLMMAMYACDVQASTDVLGRVYAVVAKRRGRIVSEEMKEGTTFFTIHALLPVVESFGFADDIRKRTSGAASPQLIFSGYELLDQDPFWVPTTEEELEDLGEKAERANVAKIYMDGVRERKGLSVDKKIVEFAEKQRTLKR